MGVCRVVLALAALILLPLLTGAGSAVFVPQGAGLPVRILAASGPALLSGVVTAGPPPTVLAFATNDTIVPFGGQYRVTNNNAPQNEVSLAVNPTNPMNLVVTANDYRGYPGLPGDGWCGVYSTSDGGRTWLEQLVPRSGALLPTTVSGDPSVAFDGDGNAYVACLGFSRTTNDNAIAVSKSTDGGRTWGTAVPVVIASPGEFHDKSYIAVDASARPTRGNVYVTWTKFMSGAECGGYSAPIYFSRSTDGGATFSIPVDIAGVGYGCDQGSQPAVGPGGELYVAWMNYVPGGPRIVSVKSLDGGLTWGPKSIVTTVTSAGDLYGGAPRTPHFPSIAVNPVNAPTGNRVHIVWTDRRWGNPDILLSTSSDGGGSWSSPVRVNDDTGMNAQFFPWVTATAKGRVHVTFYDRRDDAGDRLLTAYVATSGNFGATFGRNRRASAQFDPGTWFIGDYIGIAAMGEIPYAAWCDLRNGGEEEVYMAGMWLSVVVPPITSLPP